LTLEADIAQASADLGRALRVLVVDDEAVYRSGLATYLACSPGLEQAIEVTQTTSAAEVLAALIVAPAVSGGSATLAAPFDMIITDVDMGRDALDGFDLVRELRLRGVAALICVHSNRIIARDHKTAATAGACPIKREGVGGKPRRNLLNLLTAPEL